LQQITFKLLSEIKNTTAHALGENLWHRDSSFKMHRPGIETATRKQGYAAKEEIDFQWLRDSTDEIENIFFLDIFSNSIRF
jgi:hypothetical protein